MLHDAVDIDFDIGVEPLLAIDRIGLGVRIVVLVQPVGIFPGIGHAVAIGIPVRRTCLACQFGEACRGGILGASRVVDDIDDAGTLRHGTRIGRRACAGLLHIAGIHGIACIRSTAIEKHLLVSHLGAMCGHFARFDRLVELQLHAIDAAAVLHVGDVLAIMVGSIRNVLLATDGRKAIVVDHAAPVVVGCIRASSSHIVAIDVVTAGIAGVGVVAGRIAAVGYRNLCDTRPVLGARTCLVVVVDHVDVAATRAAIASVAIAPVVHHAVAEIHLLGLQRIAVLRGVVARPVVACAIEAGSTVLHMGNEVVVERSALAAPDAAVAMLALRMTGIGQSLAQRTPLHREVAVVVERSQLVDAPREGAVVEDDVLVSPTPGCIGSIVDVLDLRTAETDVAHDDVVTIREFHGIVTQGDTIARCRLSAHGLVRTHLDV